MKVGALHHVAIAVPSIAAAVPFYMDMLGMRVGEVHEIPGQAVRAVFVESPASRLELIEPTVASSGVARFLGERGRQTLHHVCYEVRDLDAALAELAGAGVELIDRSGRPGLAGRIAFLHPRSSGGVLIELIEQSAYSTR